MIGPRPFRANLGTAKLNDAADSRTRSGLCSAHGPKVGLVTIANPGLHLETRVTRPDILLKLLITCYFT